MTQDFTSNSPEETIELGNAIGRHLHGGEIVAIVGPLGSGKTHLIKGIARGAGAHDRTVVNSPTFVIINQYQGRLDIYHIDAYRLDSLAEFEMLGFDDLCYPESVVVVEWADKVEAALADAHPIHINVRHAGPQTRIITVSDIPQHLNVP